MKKQELIHLHGLLAQAKNHYEEQKGSSIELERYMELGIQPTSIHKKKIEHKEAVLELAREICDELEHDGVLKENKYRIYIEEAGLSTHRAIEICESSGGVEYFDSDGYLEVSKGAIGDLDDELDEELEI